MQREVRFPLFLRLGFRGKCWVVFLLLSLMNRGEFRKGERRMMEGGELGRREDESNRERRCQE
jgi:hypothetical protein